MTLSQFRRQLKRGSTGTFRRLREGEPIESADLIVGDEYYDYVAEGSVGTICGEQDLILRFEVNQQNK